MRKRLILAIALLVMQQVHAADEGAFFGLLRARDLTPFGYLRLDMRPAHAGTPAPGAWAVETDIGYQNTWALSEEVERYLTELPGRRELGPAEYQAIRDLPGENYLFDLELAQLDVTLHYQISDQWGTYLILSGSSYHGGFLDGTIEEFHDTFGFDTFGRPAASRNDVNILLDLNSTQFAAFEAPTSGGLLDPTVGVRYTGVSMPESWRLVLESAVKIPVDGRRPLLSSGRTDFGVQATVQRFGNSHALYASFSGVYYAGTGGFVPSDSQVIPTLVLAYERRLTERTNAILQGYVSPSVYEDQQTDLDELLATKYQLSLGVRHRRGAHLYTFAVTENLQNVNNTPDIGFQFGWAYVPAWRSRL
jgi:hypothetical protein